MIELQIFELKILDNLILSFWYEIPGIRGVKTKTLSKLSILIFLNLVSNFSLNVIAIQIILHQP